MNWDLFWFGIMVMAIVGLSGLMPTSVSANEHIRQRFPEAKYDSWNI